MNIVALGGMLHGDGATSHGLLLRQRFVVVEPPVAVDGLATASLSTPFDASMLFVMSDDAIAALTLPHIAAPVLGASPMAAGASLGDSPDEATAELDEPQKAEQDLEDC